MNTRNALLGLALLAMPATATAQEMQQVSDEMPSEAEVRAQVEAADAAFLAAFNSGDAAAMAATYTEDAHALPPGAPALEGREPIKEYFAAGIAAMGGAQMSFETWETHAMGDAVVSIGGYTITTADGAHLDHGKYMVVFARTDDGLKIKRDIWNSSMAPPEAEAGDAMMEEHGEMEKKHGEMEKKHDAMMEKHDEMKKQHEEMKDDQ
ncbi:MAG: YybH family protein, partial [Gemmatimonadota bacterium]